MDECESQTVDLSEPKKFQCTTCFKCYSHLNSLTRHIQTKHNSVRYQCFSCPSEFTQKSSLNEHCRNVHKEIVKNECDCGQNFNTKKLLEQHLKTHDVDKKTDCTQTEIEKKKYRKQCQICGLFFKHIEEHKLTHFGNTVVQ